MPTSVVYYPHAIYLPGGTVLSQLSDVQPAHNFVDLTEFSASQPVPQFSGTMQASPDNRFGSSQVKAILDVCTDYNIAKDFSGLGNVDLELKAGVNLGVRTPDANLAHIRARGTANTALFWESFTARQGQVVELRCRLVHIFVAASGVDPLVFTNSLALTNASDVAYLFTLGPVKINGTLLNEVEEVTWNNNITYEEVISDGDGFLTYCGVRRTAPTISIKTKDAAAMSLFGTRGTAASAIWVYLRKKLQSQINVADATAEHIKFVGSAGTIKPMNLQSGDNMTQEVMVHLKAAAQNTSPFTVSTISAIT